MDFIKIYTREAKNNSKNREAGMVELSLDFKVFNSKDLMTRGRSFYAVYDANKKLWIKDEMAVVRLVDAEIIKKVEEVRATNKPFTYGLMEDYQSVTKNIYIKNMPDGHDDFIF